MTGAQVSPPDIGLPLASIVLLAALGVYSSRRRAVPGAGLFATACLYWLLWLVGIVGQAMAVDSWWKAAWYSFEAAWMLPIATAMACFTVEYVSPGRWLTRRNRILLSIPPVLAAALIVTNDLHHLMWHGLVMNPYPRPDGNVVGWIFVGYAVSLALVQAAALCWLFAHSPPHRWPAVLILCGLIAARAFVILDIMDADPVGWLNSAVRASLVPAWAYAVALFGFRIFDPLPAAQRAVMEQVPAGVVVFDAGWRVFSLNPAAERMLGVRSSMARGKTWQQLLPSGSPLPAPSDAGTQGAGPAPDDREITFGSGSSALHYAAAVTPFNDYRGLNVGHLLVLRDITEQKRAQAQILEQQRSLATLRERERLARELHDGIGQVLGYASLQVEAALQLIDDGHPAIARPQLARLAGVLRAAHADVRQQIVELRTSPSLQEPFLALVRHYLDGFTGNYDVQTELKVSEGLREPPLSPKAQLQLLRILQEALSNARKHSKAVRVQVALEADDGVLRMSVVDHGCGFDVDRALAPGCDHFGLEFMRERAEELGGRLAVISSPGTGTRVVVEVPREEC